MDGWIGVTLEVDRMHHGTHGSDAMAFVGHSWVALVGVPLAVGAVVLILWLMTRRRGGQDATDTASPAEVEGQIMAMLHQAGREMTQVEIRAVLDLPVERVESALSELERQGHIRRRWEADRLTFGVEASG